MSDQWEKMIERLLGNESPCLLCAVRVMCDKSFVSKHGGGCPELKEKMEVAINKIASEKNENKIVVCDE